MTPLWKGSIDKARWSYTIITWPFIFFWKKKKKLPPIHPFPQPSIWCLYEWMSRQLYYTGCYKEPPSWGSHEKSISIRTTVPTIYLLQGDLSEDVQVGPVQRPAEHPVDAAGRWGAGAPGWPRRTRSATRSGRRGRRIRPSSEQTQGDTERGFLLWLVYFMLEEYISVWVCNLHTKLCWYHVQDNSGLWKNKLRL